MKNPETLQNFRWADRYENRKAWWHYPSVWACIGGFGFMFGAFLGLYLTFASVGGFDPWVL